MKKTILLIFIIAALFSCKQGSQSAQKNDEKETVNSTRKYEYFDSKSKRVIIQNSLPRGIKYTDPKGKEYSRLAFWTQLTNETENPLEFKIDFPEDPYEVPSLPGKYFKILLPSDTMKIEKVPLVDYGMTNLKSFLDTNIHKPTSLKRTIKPKTSSGFFVVILFDNKVPGPTRTGLFIKGKNLFYKVTRYTGKKGMTFVDEKIINCGSINLKNLAPNN